MEHDMVVLMMRGPRYWCYHLLSINCAMDMDRLEDLATTKHKALTRQSRPPEDSSCAWGFVRSLEDGTPAVGTTGEHVGRRSEL